MANTQDNKPSLETDKKNQKSIELKTKTSNNNNGNSKNFIIFPYLFILTIAVIGLGVYQINFTSYNQAKSEINTKALSEQKDYIETFLKSLSKNTEQNFSSIFDNQQKQINSLKKQIEESLSKNSTDWEKAEITYLIKSANLQLNIYNNPVKASALLQYAKKIAENDTNNAELLELINNDITKIKNIKVTNKTEILELIPTMLTELSNSMESNLQAKLEDQNKLNNIDSLTDNTNKDNDKNNKNSKESSFKSKLLNKLENIVVIRKHNMPTKPIFDEYERNFIMLNINIYFEALALSLLENNQEIYELYLKKLTTLISTYNLSNAKIEKQFEELKEVNFNQYANIKLESLHQ